MVISHEMGSNRHEPYLPGRGKGKMLKLYWRRKLVPIQCQGQRSGRIACNKYNLAEVENVTAENVTVENMI